MEKKKSYLFTAVCALATVILLLSYFLCYAVNTDVTANAQVEETETRGIMTKISIKIGAENCEVWAEAYNGFTLGFSTVAVSVELYSSLEYQDSIDNMQFENSNYIDDLNMYKSLTTTAPINGVKRYWRARVKYRLDNKEWETIETATYLVDVDGRLIL